MTVENTSRLYWQLYNLFLSLYLASIIFLIHLSVFLVSPHMSNRPNRSDNRMCVEDTWHSKICSICRFWRFTACYFERIVTSRNYAFWSRYIHEFTIHSFPVSNTSTLSLPDYLESFDKNNRMPKPCGQYQFIQQLLADNLNNTENETYSSTLNSWSRLKDVNFSYIGGEK